MPNAPPTEPQVPNPNGLPKISAQKPHFESATHVYDTICVGFGTVGLGLAVALSDLTLDSLVNILFLEQSPKFSSNPSSNSHPTTFAQDLATLRCPTSPFTFLNYLSENQFLEAFLTRSQSSPTTEEFETYLSWAAEQFDDVVMYGEEATQVSIMNRKGLPGKLWAVTTKNASSGEQKMMLAKRIVFATGNEARMARIPVQMTKGDRMTPVIEQMREVCNSPSRVGEEGLWSSLAARSGKLATSLLFQSEGNAARAIL